MTEPSNRRKSANQDRAKEIVPAVLLCLAFLCALFPFPARASTLQLKNLVLDNQAGAIMARFGIVLQSNSVVEDALLNGGRLKLVCEGRLLEHRSVWMDSVVAGKTYSNKLYYDFLEKMFVLEKEGSDKIFKNKTLNLLLREEWKTMVLDLGPWSTLKRGERYKLRLKVSIDQTDVPSWLRNTLFFWSWDVVPSATYQLDFTY